MALHRCICQQSSLRLREQGKISSRSGPRGSFWLTLTSAETRQQSKPTISPRRVSTQSRGRSSWICMYNHVTHSRSQSCTHAHALALVHAHIDGTWTISRNDAIILRARERAGDRVYAIRIERAKNIVRRKARRGNWRSTTGSDRTRGREFLQRASAAAITLARTRPVSSSGGDRKSWTTTTRTRIDESRDDKFVLTCDVYPATSWRASVSFASGPKSAGRVDVSA